jgi:hypothetical protein
MSDLEGLSGRERGKEYARRMDSYLETATELPLLNGSLNIQAISDATGIPTQSIHKNPAIRKSLDSAKKRFNVQSWGESRTQKGPADEASPKPQSDAKARRLEQQLTTLEQRHSAVVAENFELRRQLKELRLQFGREDMMIETGRRIVAPTDE